MFGLSLLSGMSYVKISFPENSSLNFFNCSYFGQNLKTGKVVQCFACLGGGKGKIEGIGRGLLRNASKIFTLLMN